MIDWVMVNWNALLSAIATVAGVAATVAIAFFTHRLYKLEISRDEPDVRIEKAQAGGPDQLGGLSSGELRVRLYNKGKQTDSIRSVTVAWATIEDLTLEFDDWDLQAVGSNEHVGSIEPGRLVDLRAKVPLDTFSGDKKYKVILEMTLGDTITSIVNESPEFDQVDTS